MSPTKREEPGGEERGQCKVEGRQEKMKQRMRPHRKVNIIIITTVDYRYEMNAGKA